MLVLSRRLLVPTWIETDEMDSFQIDDSNSDSYYSDDLDEDGQRRHPKKQHITEPIPPTYILAESLFMAYRRSIRTILCHPYTTLVPENRHRVCGRWERSCDSSCEDGD